MYRRRMRLNRSQGLGHVGHGAIPFQLEGGGAGLGFEWSGHGHGWLRSRRSKGERNWSK